MPPRRSWYWIVFWHSICPAVSIIRSQFGNFFSLLLEACVPRLHRDATRLFYLVNDFNMVVCQLRIRIMFISFQDGSPQSLSALRNILPALLSSSAPQSYIEPGHWGLLMASLPRQCAAVLHRDAVAMLLATLPTQPLASSIDGSTTIDHDRGTALLLAITHGVEFAASIEQASDLMSTISRKVDELRELRPIQSGDFSLLGSEASEAHALHLLLSLITLHRTSLQSPQFPRAKISQLLVSLGFLLLSPKFASNHTITSKVSDTMAFLSDIIEPDTRSFYLDAFQQQHLHRDCRVRFIIGRTEEDEGNLLYLMTMRSSQQPNIDTTTHNHAEAPTYPLRYWEMVPEATPVLGENDTSPSLGFFGTRKAIT